VRPTTEYFRRSLDPFLLWIQYKKAFLYPCVLKGEFGSDRYFSNAMNGRIANTKLLLGLFVGDCSCASRPRIFLNGDEHRVNQNVEGV
jgi:hypothetical protein